MIRINQLKLSIEHTKHDILNAIVKNLKISEQDLIEYNIFKKSIDARKKDEIYFVYTIDAIVKNEPAVLKKSNKKISFIEKTPEYQFMIPSKVIKLNNPPVIVGSGPAGLFCAYNLAKAGLNPIIFERGEDVDSRQKTIEEFWKNEILNSNSNIQFGEGGAGTFSDGKLNTSINDKYGRIKEVLKTFVKFGAPEEILYINKPHIGTDVLKNVIKNMRNEIIRLGGLFRFNDQVKDIVFSKEDNTISGVKTFDEYVECSYLVLAIGHSSRDTFEMLYQKGFKMEQKSFAVGVRIEHPQSMINCNQYGTEHNDVLGAADYKLTYKARNGRGVYSFCMCPGGYVVNASSEENMLAINGMSYSKRDGSNANSGIIVSVTPDDFKSSHPLAGVEFQRTLEKRAYEIAKGKVPTQLFFDFKNNEISTAYGKYFPCIKGKTAFSNLRLVFPEYINDALIEGIEHFNGMIKGFSRDDAILLGVESRTSSPVRILRDDNLQSNIKNVYPCGEGAGYAGGIVSAAVDGIKVFEQIVKMVYYK